MPHALHYCKSFAIECLPQGENSREILESPLHAPENFRFFSEVLRTGLGTQGQTPTSTQSHLAVHANVTVKGAKPKFMQRQQPLSFEHKQTLPIGQCIFVHQEIADTAWKIFWGPLKASFRPTRECCHTRRSTTQSHAKGKQSPRQHIQYGFK